jgi:pilus assembly protein Flp/PilA
MKTKIMNFIRDEEGASAVEYGLLLAGIAIAAIVAIRLVGTNLNTMFNKAATSLT